MSHLKTSPTSSKHIESAVPQGSDQDDSPGDSVVQATAEGIAHPGIDGLGELPLEAPSSLGNRVISGAKWTAIASLINQLVGFLRSIALARLLAPADFGLMGMVATFSTALFALTVIGGEGSIIANRTKDQEALRRHVNTVWTLHIFRGMVISLGIFLLAPSIAAFYEEPALANVARVLAFAPLISGFCSPGILLLMREVNVTRTSKFSIIEAAATGLLTVAFAFYLRDVWALVWGQIAGAMVTLAYSFFVHSHRPRWSFDRQALKQTFSFGKWILVIGIAGYITRTFDNVYVGKLLGAQVLGAYIIAFNLSELPAGFLKRVAGPILHPSFAELSDRGSEVLERVAARVFCLIPALVLLLALPFAAFAPESIHVFYGSRWEEAIVPLQLLLIGALARGMVGFISPLTMALGKSHIDGWARIVEVVMFCGLVYPATHWFGTSGTAIAVSVVGVVTLLIRLRLAWNLAPGAFTLARGYILSYIGLFCFVVALGSICRLMAHAVGAPDWLILAVGVPATCAILYTLMRRAQPDLRHEFDMAITIMRSQLALKTKMRPADGAPSGS